MDRAALAESMVGSRPALPAERLRTLLRERWTVGGELSALPSERDQNTRVDVDGRPAFVLKVLNPAEDPAFLDAQDAVAARLVEAGLPVARPIPPLDGREPVLETTAHGPARVRLVTWLDGRPLATLDHAARPAGLARELGELLGRVTVALDGLHHPGAARPFQWDVLRAVDTVERGLPNVTDAGRHALLVRRLRRLRATAPRIAALRRSVIHNDANDHNLLVDDAGRISGLLDLGDMVHSATVAELAVGQAYAMLDEPDPIATAAAVADGFAAYADRTAEEAALESDLIAARLAISAAISAHQSTLDPDPYLRISEAPVWRLLERLDELP